MTDQTSANQKVINLRDKGVKNSNGRIVKGCVKNATTKLCIGSIPSTYQSIIYRGQSKKAFGTSQKRWNEKMSNEDSQTKLTNGSFTTKDQQSIPINVSHSKKGYGPFLSKEKREWMREIKTPGPGRYEINQKTKKNLERKCITRQQKKSVPLQTTEEQSIQPGPGYYQYQKCQILQSTSPGFKSSFETKVGRNAYIPKNTNPGPGTYIRKENNQNKKPLVKEEKRSKGNSTLLKLIRDQAHQEPGPGWYSHEIPNFKPIYEKIKMSRNFISPIQEENDGNEGNNHVPSPTFYKIKRIYEGENKQLINWACFMSQTGRNPFSGGTEQRPNLKPLQEHKKHFHFNIKNHWL